MKIVETVDVLTLDMNNSVFCSLLVTFVWTVGRETWLP